MTAHQDRQQTDIGELSQSLPSITDAQRKAILYGFKEALSRGVPLISFTRDQSGKIVDRQLSPQLCQLVNQRLRDSEASE